MSEKFWFLKNCSVFEQLEPEELRRLEIQARMRVFTRRSPIYLPADEAASVLLLVSGRAKICSFTEDGKQAILAFIEPGELFGELSVFTGGEREEYAEAIEKSEVMLLPRQDIERLLESHPQVTLGITKLIGLRRKRIERRLKYLLFRSNRDRLVHLLLELAEQYGTATPEGLWIRIQLSHQDLANIIGSTRETVTLLLGELQNEGLLQVARRKIVIRDLAGLNRAVGKVSPSTPRSKMVPEECP